MKRLLMKYKWFLAASALAVAVLVVAFFSGGNVEKAREQAQQRAAVATADSAAPVSVPATTPAVSQDASQVDTQPVTVPATTLAAQPTTSLQAIGVPSATTPSSTKPDSTKPASTPSSSKPASTPSSTKPAAVKPQPATSAPKPTEAPQPQKKPQCSVSVSCITVFDNLDKLDGGIEEILPSDGWILPETKVNLQEGDTAFSVLQRVCRENNIPMEFSFTPLYDSDYVEGIGNLYEFDCGANSGWMYAVNGVFPNVGSSQVTLQNGDRVEWKYTCNLGYDVGGGR